MEVDDVQEGAGGQSCSQSVCVRFLLSVFAATHEELDEDDVEGGFEFPPRDDGTRFRIPLESQSSFFTWPATFF